MTAYRDAEQKHGPRARRLYFQSAALLEEAHDRGVAAEREELLVFRLGKSLFMSGQVDESRIWLSEAAESDSPHAIEAYELLVESYLSGTEGDPHEALRASDALMGLSLSDEQRDRARLQRGKVLVALGRHAEAAGVFEQITPGAPEAQEAVLLRVRSLIAQGSHAPALEILGEMVSDKSLRGAPLLQALYLTGVARNELGQHDEALAHFDRIPQIDPHADEAVVAALDTAEILWKKERPQESAASYSAALEQVDSPETFRNPWIELGEFQRRLQRAWDRFFEAGQYEIAVNLASQSITLLGETTATQLRASTLEQWGKTLQVKAAQEGFSEAKRLRDQAQEHLREAGRAYRHLGELRRPTAYYPNDLWQSAQNLLAGGDYQAAIVAFEDFLATNPQTRRAQALVSLGKALMALERFDVAVERFEECRDTAPKDPATFEANYLRGVCYVEMGKNELAEQVFRENLEGEFLNPSAIEWRLSLFALGKLLYQTGQYDAAIEKLSEATLRYEDHQSSDDARYLIAESYRRSAVTPKENLEEALHNAVREHYREEMQTRLDDSLDVYRKLQADLLARQRERELSEQEERLLRNCYFSIGLCWYEMGNLLEAKDAYSAAANRYQQQPAVLEAYVQIANCYRRSGQAEAARSTLETARIVLKQIPADAFPSPPTSLSQKEWDDWLRWAIEQ
jgi:tetratricopeptide (TPR) repeat protein